MIQTLKKIWAFAGKEKSNINKSVLLCFIYALFSMLEVGAIYLILSKILEGDKNPQNALFALGLLVVGILGKASMKYFSQLQQTHAGYFMAANKRIQISDKLKRVPMGYFNENSLGELTGVSTTVSETVETVAPMILVNVLSGLINSSIFTVMILAFDWRIGLIIVIGTLLYLSISAAMEKKSAILAPKRQKSQATMVSAVLEHIQGMSIVKSFNLTGKGDKALRDALANNCESNLNMTLRLDSLYDIIVELEEKIEDVKLRRKAVEQDAITLENIYTLLANFEKVYDKISDEEKKSLISSLIKEIEIFPCDESEYPLKSILFNFPVYKDGGDVCGFLWDKSTHVSTCLVAVIMMS